MPVKVTPGFNCRISIAAENQEHGSIPRKWVLSGNPETKTQLLGRTADGMSWMVFWECRAVHFQWHYSNDESFIVLSGEAFITDEHGKEHHFRAGDAGVFPAGTTVTWRTPDHFRKVAFVKKPIWLPFALAIRVWARAFNRPATASF